MCRALTILMLSFLAGWSLGCGGDTAAPYAAASLEVTPDSIEIVAGQVQVLTVRVLDGQGRLLTGVPVEFSSSDAAVVVVTPGGVVSAATTSPAAATITVRVPSGPERSIPVVVLAAVVQIRLFPDSLTLHRGQTAQLTVEALDSTGAILAGVPVTFASRDTDVVEVTGQGVITAVAIAGSTRVLATYRTVLDSTVVEVDAIVATFPLTHRPFGLAVSGLDLVYVTRLDASQLGMMAVPAYTMMIGPSVGSGPTDVAFNSSGGTAYVTNQLSQNIGVVDVGSGVQATTIPVGADPFVVAVEPGDQRVWVTTNADEVVVIDVGTSSVIQRIPVGVAPNAIAFHPSQPHAYVSTMFGGTIEKISTTTLSVESAVMLGGMPQGLAVSDDGTELYVADEGQARIVILDASTGAQVGLVPLDGGAFDLVLTPDDTQLIVALSQWGTIAVVDRVTRQRVALIPTGGVPRRLGFATDGTLLAANEAGWVDAMRW